MTEEMMTEEMITEEMIMQEMITEEMTSRCLVLTAIGHIVAPQPSLISVSISQDVSPCRCIFSCVSLLLLGKIYPLYKW